MSSPTSRTLALLRDKCGYAAEVVEKWNPHSKTRKDLFNFIDIVAVRPEGELSGCILGVQATSASNMSARKKKCQEQPSFGAWNDSARTIVIGWKKDKSKHWVPTVWEWVPQTQKWELIEASWL